MPSIVQGSTTAQAFIRTLDPEAAPEPVEGIHYVRDAAEAARVLAKLSVLEPEAVERVQDEISP